MRASDHLPSSGEGANRGGSIPRVAHCHRCGHITPTVLVQLRTALCGNCCAICRACRKGHPYASKRAADQFNHTLTPARANGDICEHAQTL